ncbi:MAG: amino acid racemase [Phycisphaerales bacterium]|nr:amino acid racemase [Phycisphaerales bacterium]
MLKHLGIVGVSPEGAAIFYRQISRACSHLLPPNEQPAISVHNEPMNQYIDAIRKDDWHTVGNLLRRSAEMLARCGARVCMTPDNIVQHGLHLAQANSPIPWMTMADLVAKAIESDGRKKVGIIGTKLVTMSSTYQTHLGLKGIQVIAPDTHEAELLDEIIFGELIYGTARPESRAAIYGVMDRLIQRGCEGVIVACSEVPLVVTQESAPTKLYDAADLLAVGAVRYAAGRD